MINENDSLNTPRLEPAFATNYMLKKAKVLRRNLDDLDGFLLGTKLTWVGEVLNTLGMKRLAQRYRRYVVSADKGAVLQIAPPRSFKSINLCANLLMYKGSSVIIDYKNAELLNITGLRRSQFSRVVRFDPFLEAPSTLLSRLKLTDEQFADKISLFFYYDKLIYNCRDRLGADYYQLPEYHAEKDAVYAELRAQLCEDLNPEQLDRFQKLSAHFDLLLQDAPVRLNICALLDARLPNFYSFVDMITNAIILSEKADSQPYFANKARSILSTTLLFTLATQPPEFQNLAQVYEIIQAYKADGEEFDFWLEQMLACEALDGAIARRALEYKAVNDKELRSVISTLSVHLDFLSSPHLRTAISANDLDLRTLKTEAISLFITLPTQAVRFNSRLMRLAFCMTSLAIQAQAGKPSKPVWFVFDELPAAGNLGDALFDAIAVQPAMGLRVIGCIQAISQLKATYPDTWQILLNLSTTQLYRNVSDETAQHLAKQIGQRYIRIKDGHEANRMPLDVLLGHERQSRWQSVDCVRPDQLKLYDQIIALIAGNKAAILDPILYYKDENFKPFALPNPLEMPL